MAFEKRTIFLRSEQQREILLALVRNLPLDASKPLQCTVEEFRQPRKPSQNSLMWSGPLKDIADQAFLDGKQFSTEAWHEFFKAEFLPEEFDPLYCRDGYQKYDYTPRGDRFMKGSTTMLTVKGFALYLQQVEAFGASLGVEYHANPKQHF